MPVYTIEIGGQAIGVFNAGSKREAQRHVHAGGAIADDLVLFRLLPDEDSARKMVVVREATPIEYNRWQASNAEDKNSDEPMAGYQDDEDELMHLLWLAPVHDPTNEDF
jgi:hypothetical protein